jgi:hypothetical protein
MPRSDPEALTKTLAEAGVITCDRTRAQGNRWMLVDNIAAALAAYAGVSVEEKHRRQALAMLRRRGAPLHDEGRQPDVDSMVG